MQLSAPPTLALVHGPSTASAAALQQWLEQQHVAVRLPVLVKVGRYEAKVLSKDPLALTLQDSALGVSLEERARAACPKAEHCALWLEGTWRHQGLFVTRVVRAVTPEEQAGPLFAQLEVAEGRLDLAALVDKLGSDAPLADKRDAAQALRGAGRDAIPLLIASLADARPFEVRDIANRMNLPRGAKVEPVMSTLSVGARCEDLLHAIVTPAVESPPIKVFSEQVLRIADWRAFWDQRRDRTLEQIHAELTPLVREYWKAHGTTQTVP